MLLVSSFCLRLRLSLNLRSKFSGAVRVLTGSCGSKSCEPRVLTSPRKTHVSKFLNAVAKTTPAKAFGTLKNLLASIEWAPIGVAVPA